MLSSTRLRVLVGAVALVLVSGSAVLLVQTRDDANAPHAAHEATARAELEAEVVAHRQGMHAPAVDARANVASLRLLLADAIVGSDQADGDDVLLERINDRAARVHAAADRIDDAAHDAASRPSAVSVASDVTPVLQRLDNLGDQAPDVTERLRAAADDAVDTARAAIGLRHEVASYASATGELSDSDDPDDLVDAWSQEVERLAAYRSAAESAAARPELADHAAAHLAVIDLLEELADAALDDLEDGDLDAYNDRLGDHPDQLDAPLEELHDSLEDAVTTAVGDLEAAENRTLGLLVELDELRTTSG